MRARIGHKAAFLTNQPIHISRIKVDGSGAGNHSVFVRHGEALFKVDGCAGAFAGVDAAVPHLVVAGVLRGGQQFPVAHHAGFALCINEVGGVVPFAHALATQAHANGVERALQ